MISLTSVLSTISIGNKDLYISSFFLITGLAFFLYSIFKYKEINESTKLIGSSFIIMTGLIVSKILSFSIHPLFLGGIIMFIIFSLISWIQDTNPERVSDTPQALSLMILCVTYLSIAT